MASRNTPRFESALRTYLQRVSRQARVAARRLQHATDVEALHDFRVAVRRLRTYLAAFHRAAGLQRRAVRQWRRLARATNAARDREILLGWLKSQRSACPIANRATLAVLIRSERRNNRHATRDVIDRLHERWPRRARQLADTATALAQVTPDHWLRQVRRRVRELRHALAVVGTYRDTQQIHRARILAKHARYLLEPFRTHADIAATIDALTALQDAFGKSNDRVVIVALLGELQADAPDVATRLELHRLRRLARQQQRDEFLILRARFLGSALTPIFAALDKTLRHFNLV